MSRIRHTATPNKPTPPIIHDPARSPISDTIRDTAAPKSTHKSLPTLVSAPSSTKATGRCEGKRTTAARAVRCCPLAEDTEDTKELRRS